MRKLTALSFFFIPFACFSQYRGGQNDGHATVGSLQQNETPSIYAGGSNDGFDSRISVAVNLTPTIYLGGNNDGFSGSSQTGQNSIPSIYLGGNNDGFHSLAIAAQNPFAGIYLGGNNDGFHSSFSADLNAGENIYLGGNNDGFDQDHALAANPLPGIYSGGFNDGWATIHIGNQNPFVILAVKLIEFTAHWQEDDVLLRWRTASEVTNDHFEIERSDDLGATYHVVGVVPGNGTTNSVSAYALLDTTVHQSQQDVFFYRLKPVDQAGKFIYSAIVRLERSKRSHTFVLYPNPTNGNFKLEVKGPSPRRPFGYTLFNVAGEYLQGGVLTGQITPFDLSKLQAGIYWLRITSERTNITTIKIVLQK